METFIKIINVFLIIILCSINFSCKTSTTNENHSNFKLSVGNIIAFIDLKLFKSDSPDSINAELLGVDLVPGTLKDPYASDTVPAVGYLVLSILNKENKILKKIIFENPLDKSVEFVNSKNELDRKTISSTEEKITFRIQYNPDFYYLTIDKIGKNLIFQNIYKTVLITEGRNEK